MSINLKLEYFTQEVSKLLSLNDLQALGGKLLLMGCAFLTPVCDMLFSLLFLVAVDLVTGVLAARKRKQKLSSSKLSRAISKLLVYFTTIIVVHVTNKYLLFGADFIPLESFVVGFIALTELKSIFENLNKVSSHDFLKVLNHKLSNEGRKKEEDS